jgi:hypothetical protein
MTRGGRHGSLVNHLMDRSLSPVPVVGMGATELMWSDRHPYTIIAVNDEKHVVVQEDTSVRVPGSNYHDNKWTITQNPYGATKRLSLRKDRRWKLVGHTDPSFLLGSRQKYYDTTF